MPIFAKPQPNGEPRVTPQITRSRFQLVLDHMNLAHHSMDQAAAALSSLILDIEKGMKFIDRFRVDLTKAIEETGSTVDPAGIEEQIRAFITPQMQKVDE